MKKKWCRLCMEEIINQQSLFEFLRQDSLLCGACRHELAVLNKTVKLEWHKAGIYRYMYNDFLKI